MSALALTHPPHPGKKNKTETHNRLILDAIRLAPRRHHKRVVARDEDHLVHPRRLELGQLVEVRLHVLRLARRREGAGDGHEHGFLGGELLAGVVLLREPARGQVEGARGRDVGECDGGGEGGAGGEGGHFGGGWGGWWVERGRWCF